MDKKLRSDIRKQYWNEYYPAAQQKIPGFLGKFTRWNARMDKHFEQADVQFSTPVAIMGAVAVGFGVSVLTGGALPVVAGIATFVGYMGSYFRGLGHAASQARKDVDADIDNGTLPARYKAILEEKLIKSREDLAEKLHGITAEAETKQASLSARIADLDNVGPTFNAAAVKTDTAPQVPKRQRRFHWSHRPSA